jgi:hypothetical protein
VDVRDFEVVVLRVMTAQVQNLATEMAREFIRDEKGLEDLIAIAVEAASAVNAQHVEPHGLAAGAEWALKGAAAFYAIAGILRTTEQLLKERDVSL